ncbi:Mitochondrial-processing peptidase subunit alpha [Coemansia thaxteri]|uniref:Alpha-MPP n=1 Tax=Coemansia thaxteri TaxID=2663907 RepID=A0A9W8EHA8_9FUNG|nr:Mitochondrial-processing peptidase subunit alpha [Coemansia thaxteri]
MPMLLRGAELLRKHSIATALRSMAGYTALSGLRYKSTTAATAPVGPSKSHSAASSGLRGSTVVSGDGQTHVTTLSNGLRVTSERSPGHFTAVGVYVDGGSRYEDKSTSGYAHLMDRLAFRSSERFSSAESMAMIEKLGGSIMSSSSRECIMYQAAVFPHDVPTALKLLADTTLRPMILPEEVDELRVAVPWELQDVESKPDMFLPEKLHEVAFRTGTLGNPLLCPVSQLNAATPESLSAYHRRWYRPERIVVAAVGVDHEDLVRMCCENGFADLAPLYSPTSPAAGSSEVSLSEPSAKSWFNKILGASSNAHQTVAPGGRSVYTGGTWFDPKPDMDFTQIYLAFKSAGIDNEQQLYTYATLQMLLGGGGSFSAGGPGKGMYSRLYTRVLNQHAWIESCAAFHHCYADSGLFGISASCRPRNEHALLDVIATELEAVALGRPAASSRTSSRRPYTAHDGLSTLEVRRAKNQLKSNLLMNLESRMVQLEDLGRQVQVSGHKVPADTMIERIEAVTPQDISNAAKELLESPATLVAQGYVDGIKQFYPQIATNHKITI